jgi:juvenile hormone epoxide hydrolase
VKTAIASVYPKAFVAEEHVEFFFPQLPKLADLVQETGYFHIQATKPDTIGAALTDNPIGLAAYILEKFVFWTDNRFRDLADGGLTKHYTLDNLLHNLMFYYLPNSIQTSQRLYAETFSVSGMSHQLDRVPMTVPAGCARFRYDLAPQIDWALQEKFANLIHSTYHHPGGHFAAMQMPEILLKDFISFVKKLD